MKKDGIILNGVKGTWYVIDETIRNSRKVLLLESEIYGDELPNIIIDEQSNILELDSYNGFDDL